jgi:hypothetical protein
MNGRRAHPCRLEGYDCRQDGTSLGTVGTGIERDQLAENLLSFAQLAPQAASETELIGHLMGRVSPYGITHITAGVMSDSNRTFKVGTAFWQAQRRLSVDLFRQSALSR